MISRTKFEDNYNKKLISLSFSSDTHQEINVGMKERKIQLIL